jgi:hypothetical protein
MKTPPTGAAIRRSANGKDRIKRESRRWESFVEGWEENQCFSLNSRLTALNLCKHEMCSGVHARLPCACVTSVRAFAQKQRKN